MTATYCSIIPFYFGMFSMCTVPKFIDILLNYILGRLCLSHQYDSILNPSFVIPEHSFFWDLERSVHKLVSIAPLLTWGLRLCTNSGSLNLKPHISKESRIVSVHPLMNQWYPGCGNKCYF